MQILAAGFELAATRQYPEIDKTRYHCTKCRATWYKLANGLRSHQYVSIVEQQNVVDTVAVEVGLVVVLLQRPLHKLVG